MRRRRRGPRDQRVDEESVGASADEGKVPGLSLPLRLALGELQGFPSAGFASKKTRASKICYRGFKTPRISEKKRRGRGGGGAVDGLHSRRRAVDVLRCPT